MRKEYYTGLRTHLSNLSSIEIIDYDLQQYSQSGDDVVRITPALYIGFPSINWTQLTQGVQTATIDFSTTLVSSPRYGDDRDILDTEHINHLDIENHVYQALQEHRLVLSDLQGFDSVKDTDNDFVLMESIVRAGTSTHQQINNLMITKTTYRSQVFDYTAMTQYQKLLVQLGLDIKMVKKLK